MRSRWEAYRAKRLWRYAGWRKVVFTDLVWNAILYLGYNGEAPSLTVMARELGCHHSHLRQEIITLLDKMECIKIVPHKWNKTVVLTEKGWKIFVLVEALHVVFEQTNKDLMEGD